MERKSELKGPQDRPANATTLQEKLRPILHEIACSAALKADTARRLRELKKKLPR